MALVEKCHETRSMGCWYDQFVIVEKYFFLFMNIPLEGLQIRPESIQWSIFFLRQNYVFEGLSSSVIVLLNLFEQWSVNCLSSSVIICLRLWFEQWFVFVCGMNNGLSSSVIILMNLFEQWSVNTNGDEYNFSCTLYFVSNFWCISDIRSFSNFIEIPWFSAWWDNFKSFSEAWNSISLDLSSWFNFFF